MPAWLRRVYTSIVFTVFAVTYGPVLDLIVGIANALRNMHNHLNDGLDNLWFGAHQLWSGVKLLSEQSALSFYDIYRFRLPRILSLLSTLARSVDARFSVEMSQRRQGDRAIHDYAAGAVASLFRFVVLHVVEPLLSLAARVTFYVVSRINPMWHYFTHLIEFADLLFWFIVEIMEREAMNVAKRTARFFVAMVMHNLMTLLLILEDAISAAL